MQFNKFSSIEISKQDKWNCICKHNENIEITDFISPPKENQNLALSGLTFAASDSLLVKGIKSCAGNPCWFDTHSAAEITSIAIQKLVDNGATLVAKTQMDELAYCLTGVNDHYGTPINPHSPHLIPGGSSSGAAVLVSSKLVDFGLGTDAGGSVRVPASFCNILGLRPTLSRVSLFGVVPFSPSIQTIGFYARDIDVMLKITNILLPSSSSHSNEVPTIDNLIIPSQAFSLLNQNTPKSIFDPVLSTLKTLIPNEIDQEFDLITMTKTVNTIIGFEASNNHKEWVETEKPKFSELIGGRFTNAAKISQEDAKTAFEYQNNFKEKMNKIMLGEDGKSFNIIVVPTTPGSAYLREAPLSETDNFRFRTLQLNSIAGLAGLPQINLNIIQDNDKNAIGVSLIGPAEKDLELCQFAKHVLKITNFPNAQY